MSLQIQRSLTLLYPVFASQLVSCLAQADTLGLNVYLFEGYRSPERQEMLYNQTPKVTDAHAWMSWHQYGLAIDLAFGGPGKWSWKGPIDDVRKLFISRGFRLLENGKDLLHVEYDHDLLIHNARQIALKEGILEVWLTIEASKKYQN